LPVLNTSNDKISLLKQWAMFGITTIKKESCMHMKKASGLMFALEVIHTNTAIYSAAAPLGPVMLSTPTW